MTITMMQHQHPVFVSGHCGLVLPGGQQLPIVLVEDESGTCGSSAQSLSYRWPAHVAANMTDSIHQEVEEMLRHSRLRQESHTNSIQLLRPEDVWKVERGNLGAGAFSQVSSVISSIDGKRYACKHLKPDLMSQPEQFRKAATELAYEAHMMSAFDHPNILKIRGWARNGIASFEDGRHNSFFLLLDVLDETLEQRIDKWNARISSDPSSASSVMMEKIQVLMEIASALDYVHEHGVIFRDLKPNNIGMLNGHVQLFDFGLARELPSMDTTTPFQMSGKVGTIRYMAPEVVLHQPYNVSSDVYSWSMVAYEVLTGIKPYQGWTPEGHKDYVCQRGYRPDLTMLPVELQLMLQQAWHGDARQRPTLQNLQAQLSIMYEQEIERLRLEEQRELLVQQQLIQQQYEQQQQQLLHQQQQQVYHVPTMDYNVSYYDQQQQMPPQQIPAQTQLQFQFENNQFQRKMHRSFDSVGNLIDIVSLSPSDTNYSW